MMLETFFEKFDQFADAPNAVAKVRELVLDLAIQGKLVERKSSEGDGHSLLRKLRTLPPERNSKSRSPKDIVVEPEAPLEIPSHWALTTVENTTRETGFFCDGDWVESKDQDPDGDVRLIQLADVGDGQYRDRSSRFMTKAAATRLNCSYLEVGDILVARMPDPLGRCCRFPGDPKTAVTVVDVCILRPNVSFFDPDFLVIAINCPRFRRLVSAQATGTTRSRISRSNLGVLPIPLPPLAEQKRIVAKVDELMALCERLEAQQQERETRHAALARASLARFADAPTPANLNFLFHDSYSIDPADLRKSILTLAVQGKLVPQDPNDEPGEELLALIERDRAALANEQGVRPPKNVPPLTADNYPHDIPASWVWSRIGHLALLIDYGTSQKADSDSSKVPVYRMGNIVSGRLVDENLKYVDAGISDLPGLYLKTDDILFNRTNSYELVGKAGIYTGPDDTATFASYLIRIRLPSTLLFPPFYNVAMNAPYYRQTQIEPEVVQQCGQANFNGTKLASTVVPLPPLAEQRRIVKKVDELMALVNALEAQLATARTTAEKLMEAVVAELTGISNNGNVSGYSASVTERRSRPPKS